MSNRAKTAKSGRRFSLGDKVLVLVIIVVVVGSISFFSQPPQSGLTARTEEAPDFSLPVVGPSGLTNDMLTLSSFRGRVVFLEFMAPSCRYCQQMEPTVAQLYANYHDQGVIFVSVAIPSLGDRASDVANYIQSHGSQWIFVWDSSGSLINSYKLRTMPTFFIIDKNGIVQAVFGGAAPNVTYEMLAAAISKINS